MLNQTSEEQIIDGPLLLDTHILLWSLLTPEKINTILQSHINHALTNKSLYIAGISLWEIAMLVAKGRINVYMRIDEFLKTIENIKGLNVCHINSAIAADSASLPGDIQGDPADQLIIATARELSATLATADQAILTWAEQGHLKVIT